MGLINGFVIYDFRGNILVTSGQMPAATEKINKKIIVDATAKVLCNDGSFIIIMTNCGMRYIASSDDQSRCLSMLQEMILSPIDHAIMIFESYNRSPIDVRDIPDATIITLREDNIIGIDETSILMSSEDDKKEDYISTESSLSGDRAKCKRMFSYILLASMVASLMLLAASSLIFVIITDRPF